MKKYFFFINKLMSKRNSKEQNKIKEQINKDDKYPDSRKMDKLFRKYIEKNNENNEKIRKTAKSIGNKKVREKILKKEKNISMNTTFKYDINNNDDNTKNNPYYYDLKDISNNIEKCKKICLELENKVNNYCVCSDKNAFEDFKKIKKNTIKLNDNISFIKGEIKEYIIKNHELNTRLDNDENNFKKILLKNQEINEFISHLNNLNKNNINNKSYKISNIN